MRKYNAKNERIKKDYFEFLKEAEGKSQQSLDSMAKSIRRFEEFHHYKDLATFSMDQAISFKKFLYKTKTERTDEPLSKSTLLSIMNNLKSFFKWLSVQKGYKSKIDYTHISYLNLSEKDTRAAKAQKMPEFPSLEQIKYVIKNMPTNNEIEMRNRALIAFTILTGIRVDALISLKLRHIDLDKKLVTQDPNQVKTKFSKMIHTYFFPVGEEIQKIVEDWVNYLIQEKHFGYDAPLFPKTLLKQNEDKHLKASGITSQHWKTTTSIRNIFKEAFEGAKLRYYNPHSFRHTLSHLMQSRCSNMEEIKAWSQNLGHESPVTTFSSYGNISPMQQGEIIKKIYDQN